MPHAVRGWNYRPQRVPSAFPSLFLGAGCFRSANVPLPRAALYMMAKNSRTRAPLLSLVKAALIPYTIYSISYIIIYHIFKYIHIYIYTYRYTPYQGPLASLPSDGFEARLEESFQLSFEPSCTSI